jgi:hypothetical protein
MPSFTEVMGVIVIYILLSLTFGHGEGFQSSLVELRKFALTRARQDWGCPSLTGKAACTSYDSNRYR